MIPQKHFYIIRHGETESNVAEICAGDIDAPLTAKGRAEAAAVAPIVEQLAVPPTVIVHSHLSRARDTAALINQNLKLPMHEDRRLGERNFGDWQGGPMAELYNHISKGHEPPNGETQEVFYQRVKDGISEALLAHPGPVLFVCHGWVFRALGAALGIGLRGVKNCQLYEFTSADGAWRIKKYDLPGDEIVRKIAG